VRTWNLNTRDPLNLVISADANLSSVEPLDDHTWEINLEQGEPRALAIRSRFGMRAVEMRYFPLFLRGHEQLSDPASFFSPLILKRSFPNYLEFTSSPFEDVEVSLEYWVPESRVVAGRITLVNHDPARGKLDVDWIGQLTPLAEGANMVVETVSMNQVLAGRCGGLYPVCFISGGCREGTSAYPGLALEVHPRKTNPQVFTWASAAFEGMEESFNAARNASFRNWEAEISRVEITAESRMLEIQTANADWDAALHASQKTGFSLFMPSPKAVEKQTFVRARNIGDGFPDRRDVSDHPPDWGGQSALDAWYLSTLLLPGGAEPLRDIQLNFLSTQHRSGQMDWSLSLGGAHARVNAQPVLAQLTLRLAPYFTDRKWLRPLLPQLTRFFLSWFLPDCDRDQDGFPEWRSSGQSNCR